MNVNRVADLTIDEFTELIRQTVFQAMREFDPDEGLALKPEVTARLQEAQQAKREGKKRATISHEQMLKELDLDA